MDTRTPEPGFPDINNFKGMSTYDILVFLYKTFMNVVSIPNDNRALNFCVNLDAKTGILKEEIDDLPKLAQKCDAIRIIIDKLKTTNSAPIKQIAEVFSKQMVGLEEKVKHYGLSMEDILNAYQSMVIDQQDKFKSILTRVAASKDGYGMADSQDIQQELKRQETKYNEIRHKVKLLDQQERSTLPLLEDLHKQSFNSLPPADRKLVISPTEEVKPRGAAPAA